MKRKIFLLLALTLLFAFAVVACATEADPDPTPTPEPTPAATTAPPPPPPPAVVPDVFPWNDFTDRDPANKPDTAPNGMSMWWDNWANLRAGVDNGVVEISFRPGEFDPEDYDNLGDYYDRATDWMGNWGEAIDMWALDGISYCKYMTIRMAGAEGGEESRLMLHFQPEDGPSFVARFADLVTQGGGHPEITTDMQDIVIDLQASGFPGMTNRMHIRAFQPCTIFLDEIYFSEPVAPVDTTSAETIIAGFTVEAIGNPADLPIRSWTEFVWNNFTERDPQNKPDHSTNGMNIWWDNWANLRAASTDIGVQIEFRPEPFDSEDYDDEDDYFERAADWMGNWGEAVNMWGLDSIAFCKYMTIAMAGLEGGEEDKLMLHFQPEDGPSYVARFSDLVLKGGGNLVVPDMMDEVIIDLEASGFPGMTNRMHIRAFEECGIILSYITFSTPIADRLDTDDPVAGIKAPPIGQPGDLPIRDFLAELS